MLISMLENLLPNQNIELISLTTFSSDLKLVAPFTKNYEMLKNKISSVKVQNKCSLIAALNDLSLMLLKEWGTNETFNIIVVSDGNIGSGYGSLRAHFQTKTQRPISFPFPCAFYILLINDIQNIQMTLPHYEKLAGEINTVNRCKIFYPFWDETINGHKNSYHGEDMKSPLGRSLECMFEKVFLECFEPQVSQVICGNITGKASIFPPIPRYIQELYLNDHEDNHETNSEEALNLSLHIQGFVDYHQIISLPHFTKHLLLPVVTSNIDSNADKSNNPSPAQKIPSFLVLLHGSLKIENMAALCRINLNCDERNSRKSECSLIWFGFLYSSFTSCENKKKSNLYLSTLPIGPDPSPTLGRLLTSLTLHDAHNYEYLPALDITPSTLPPSILIPNSTNVSNDSKINTLYDYSYSPYTALANTQGLQAAFTFKRSYSSANSNSDADSLRCARLAKKLLSITTRVESAEEARKVSGKLEVIFKEIERLKYRVLITSTDPADLNRALSPIIKELEATRYDGVEDKEESSKGNYPDGRQVWIELKKAIENALDVKDDENKPIGMEI
ncbi:integrator complex subunit 14-like isoform X1 [Gordionus sp. m RMFG-2023]|uniref:integrator complex subunit 14-like isoform X1 n=1 Tax=Gordionus sp. m RMFG-2023 TaxID=3053472 RepID=UPI0031FD33C1